MDERVMELINRARIHNVDISMKFYSTKNYIEIIGECEVKKKGVKDRELHKVVRRVTSQDLKYTFVDLIEYEINDVIRELIRIRKEVNG